jgi:predicted nucleic acid-binding protein
MSVRSFLDTNVLVYTDDRSNPAKHQRALDVFAEHRSAGTGVISVQVLQEYFVTVTRKFKLDPLIAQRKTRLLADLHVVVPDAGDVLAAIDLHRLHGFSVWDALVVHSAKQAGCRVLLSEDLQHGRDFDGLLVVNPFRSA